MKSKNYMRRKSYRTLLGITSATFNLLVSTLVGVGALILSIYSGEYSSFASMLIALGASSYTGMMVQTFTSLGINKQMELMEENGNFSDSEPSRKEKEMDKKALETIEKLTEKIERELKE